MSDLRGDLNLGHVLAAAGLTPADVLLIRHSLYSQHSPKDLTPEEPPPIWVVFLADSKTRCRLEVVYENHGVTPHPNPILRNHDLIDSEALSSLWGRLQVDWGRDTINWVKRGTSAAKMPILEIADRASVPFPGYDGFVLTHSQLQEVVTAPRYEAWQTALGAVQGIYVTTDTSTGQVYVGKADGGENILGRWRQYANDGHVGNKTLRALAKIGSQHARHFQFSLLRVLDPPAQRARWTRLSPTSSVRCSPASSASTGTSFRSRRSTGGGVRRSDVRVSRRLQGRPPATGAKCLTPVRCFDHAQHR